ncbi:MAG TPA: ABC transporter substrate-binding protein, partial [Opitutus sp.]|nr:ABC transporter substrate-binding protein [Opitutus sp.]
RRAKPMTKRLIIVLTLALTVALPFLLRPERRATERADETLIVITPHNEAIRHEFGAAFRRWYRAKTGRSIAVDWRVIGGTSEIARFLQSEYVASFRHHWTRVLGRSWSADVQNGFTHPRLAADSPVEAREARAAFLASKVGCGIDVFFGGGPYDFIAQAEAGRIVPAELAARQPQLLTEQVIPHRFAGEQYWDQQGRWFGNVLSSYGILSNRDALRRLGIAEPPSTWRALTDPRLLGQVALADPTKSSSIAKAFENVIQQEIQQRIAAGDAEPEAVRAGWRAGLQVLQLMGANARYFTDSSQKPPIDVAQGDCAAGVCIDFYGRSQAEVTGNRAGEPRLVFVTPRGGTVSSVDPIAILRGAPNRNAAEAFLEFTLSMEGQKLWTFRPGTEGGPERFALRLLPVRRDFYEQQDWLPLRSDPEAAPYGGDGRLVYRPEFTERVFRELAFVIRVMTLDTHRELVAAWRAIQTAPEPAKNRALERLQDLSAVSYDQANGAIKRALTSKHRVDEITLARELGTWFRANYAEAERLARAGN